MEQLLEKTFEVIKVAHQNRLKTIEKFNGAILELLDTPAQSLAKRVKKIRDEDMDEGGFTRNPSPVQRDKRYKAIPRKYW